MSLKEEWSFRENRIARENIGEHDADNRFLMEPVHWQLKTWKRNHEDCIPIGICYDEEEENYGCYPMVFEDRDGNRFYTHVDIKTIEEYIELEEKGKCLY